MNLTISPFVNDLTDYSQISLVVETSVRVRKRQQKGHDKACRWRSILILAM